MRLINTSTLELETFSGEQKPPYAILSHTWLDDKDEVTFQEFQDSSLRPQLQDRAGFMKIKQFCDLAREKHKLEYAWVDTCAVDKTSSAELSEAINSMFNWYKHSRICIVYFSDLASSGKAEEGFCNTISDCRWFGRGWTLQELLAPKRAEFYDRTWKLLGSKDDDDFVDILGMSSGIDRSVLQHSTDLLDISIATRMSWAAHRSTTRGEDQAYCLLGIFDVNMPLLYGEGAERSFIRLQEQIINSNPDLSIFAWANATSGQEYMGILAASPWSFFECQCQPAMHTANRSSEHSITNHGIKLTAELRHDPETGICTMSLNCIYEKDRKHVLLYLRQIAPTRFVRVPAPSIPAVNTSDGVVQNAYVLKTLTLRQAARLKARELDITLEDAAEFGKCTADPLGCVDPSASRLVPDFENTFTAFLEFTPDWAGEFDSFVVACRCPSSRGTSWSVNLISGDDWQGRDNLEKNKDFISGFGSGMSLTLGHLYDQSVEKIVSAGLGSSRDGRAKLTLSIDERRRVRL